LTLAEQVERGPSAAMGVENEDHALAAVLA
jgi:hypothetical protein